MQLKIVHVKSEGDCEFKQEGEAKVVLVDRRKDTYATLKSLVME